MPFNAGAASGPGATVEFKKRPFGILRYQPGAVIGELFELPGLGPEPNAPGVGCPMLALV